jgi:hypothetical protein
MAALEKGNKKATGGCAVAGVTKFRVTYLETGALRESTAEPPPKSTVRTEFLMFVLKIAIVVRSFPIRFLQLWVVYHALF